MQINAKIDGMDTSIGTEKSKNIYRGTYKKRSPYHEDRSCASEYLVLSQTAVFDARWDYPKTKQCNTYR